MSYDRPTLTPHEASTSELVSRLGQEASRLVHDELQRARIVVSGMAKKAGLFAAAGLIAKEAAKR